MAGVAAKKLILTYVDSLRTDMLERAVAEGRAPTFGALIERGVLVARLRLQLPLGDPGRQRRDGHRAPAPTSTGSAA